jgi:hypothetical protein
MTDKPPPIPPTWTIERIRNEIVNGVIKAAEAGALCEFPASFEMQIDHVSGLWARYTLPITPTPAEWERLRLAQEKAWK